jgi:hypothetical protein
MQEMHEERAHALLREERQRLERLLTSVDTDHGRVAPADEVSEDLADGADRRTLEETDEAVARQAHEPVGGAAAGRGPPGCGHLRPLGPERPTEYERGSGTAVLVPGAPSRGTALFAMLLNRYRSGPLTTR